MYREKNKFRYREDIEDTLRNLYLFFYLFIEIYYLLLLIYIFCITNNLRLELKVYKTAIKRDFSSTKNRLTLFNYIIFINR